jgi:hypothetical protein
LKEFVNSKLVVAEVRRAVISTEEAILVATQRVLPAGFKPEDYLVIGEDIPLRIAKMIVQEAQHIIAMDGKYGNKNHLFPTSTRYGSRVYFGK